MLLRSEAKIHNPWSGIGLKKNDTQSIFVKSTTQDKFMRDGVMKKWESTMLGSPWKPRYFVLRLFEGDPFMVAYASKSRMSEMGRLPLEGSKLEYFGSGTHDLISDAFLWGITAKGEDNGFLLANATSKERTEWMTAVRNLGGMARILPSKRDKIIEGSIMEGFLEKMGQREKSNGWKVRYFILSLEPKPQIV